MGSPGVKKAFPPLLAIRSIPILKDGFSKEKKCTTEDTGIRFQAKKNRKELNIKDRDEDAKTARRTRISLRLSLLLSILRVTPYPR
jgi:hypothetical protein